MRFFLKRYKLSLLNLGFYFIFNEPPENYCCPKILCMIISSLFLSLRSGVSGTIEDGGNNIMKIQNGIQVISQWNGNGNCNCNSIHSLNANHSKRFPNPSVISSNWCCQQEDWIQWMERYTQEKTNHQISMLKNVSSVLQWWWFKMIPLSTSL